MKTVLKKNTKALARVILLPCLAAICTLLCSCPKTPEKPIPPLDPLKVAKKDKTSVVPARSKKPGYVSRMPLGELFQLVQGNAALIFDVRPTIFHKIGNIPGSISWPKAAFERNLTRHEPRIREANKQNTPVVVYCTDLACPDAATVAKKLAARGHSVSILQGGYDAWKNAAP